MVLTLYTDIFIVIKFIVYNILLYRFEVLIIRGMNYIDWIFVQRFVIDILLSLRVLFLNAPTHSVGF